jgi:tetratricopeptide (TPR) repeat protein
MSFKSLYQLMKIVSISAFATNDYLKIEPFLLKTYEVIQTHINKEKQLYYNIQVLYLIAYTLFRNKKFDTSLEFLERMHDLMQLKQGKYYSSLKLKYNLLLALNLNFLNQQNKAIKILEPFLIVKHPDIESLLDIYLSLVMFNIQKGDFKKARQIFSKFYHTDKWYISKAGKEWVIKKNLIEILLHIELKNIDLVESRLLSFKRNYYNFLKEVRQQRAITYLNLVNDYYKTPEKAASKAFKNKVETSFEWVSGQQEDIFVMSFYAWLKSKMDNENLYKTTLNLVKKAQIVNS